MFGMMPLRNKGGFSAPISGNTASKWQLERTVKIFMEYENTSRSMISTTVKTGIGFGSALAIAISYVTWKSIGWAMLHGILGWLYVIYYIIRYGWS